MISWFNKLFEQEKVETDSFGLPRVDNLVPMPKVKPPKPERDISEPVYAIAECMKKYPSRFKIRYPESGSKYAGQGLLQVKDVKTKDVAVVAHGYRGYLTIGEWSWLTVDEVDYLERVLVKIEAIKQKRKDLIKRAKYKEIYK